MYLLLVSDFRMCILHLPKGGCENLVNISERQGPNEEYIFKDFTKVYAKLASSLLGFPKV